MLGREYLLMVLSRWKLVAVLVIGCTLGAWAFSTLVLAQKPTFTSAARLNIVPTSEELGYANRFVRGSTFDGGSVLLQTYAEFAHTRPVVAPIVDRYIAEQSAAAGQTRAAWIAANSVPSIFSPGRIVAILNYGEAPVVPLREDLIDNVIKYTTIETVEGTYLLRLSVEWDDPVAAAWFANALADAIVARAETMSRSSGTQIADSLVDRLTAKKAELAATLRQSRDLKSSAGVVDIDRQKQSLLEARVLEQSQLTSDRAQLQSNEGQVAGLRSQTGGRLSSAQAILEQTIAIEGPKAAGLKRGIDIREGRVAQIGQQIASLGKYEDRIKSLDDAAVALQTEVTALTERVSFSQTENLANAPRIQLIERAIPPLVRSSPKTLFNTALGFIAGCALAGIALLLLGGAPAKVRDEPEELPALPPRAPLRALADPMPAPRPRTSSAAAALAAAPREDADQAPEPASETPPEPAPARAPAPIVRIVRTEAEAPPAPILRPDVTEPPRILPRPQDGEAYTTREVAEHAPGIAAWLGDSLHGPLLIAATAEDIDAQDLYRLIYGERRAADARFRTYDATSARIADIPGDAPALVYAGGFSGSGRETILANLPVDMGIAIAVPVRDPADAHRLCEAARRRFAAIARREPHVVAIQG